MKTFRKFDPDNDEVLFRYSMESCIGEMEQARYINEIHIDIIGRTIDGIEYKMGEAERKILLLSLACNDNVDPFDIFDYSQSLMEIGDVIYDYDQGWLKDEITSVCNIEHPDICVFERLCILPQYRGLGLAKKLVKDNVMRLGDSCGLIVMKPFPLQCEGTMDGDVERAREFQYRSNPFEADMEHDHMEQDPDIALKQLVKYYKSIGYFTIKGMKDLMFICPSAINKKLDKIDINGI